MQLRDMLKRDFDLDLAISGGFGQSRGDPIIVLDCHGNAASQTIFNVLRGLGRGRQILWTMLADSRIDPQDKFIHQVKILTKFASKEEIITQRENYYFDLTASAAKHLATPIIYSDTASGIRLPYEIRWWHFDNIIDNEKQHPGLGQTIAYGGPGMKVTVYVYGQAGQGIPSDLGSTLAVQMFDDALSDIAKAHPSAKSVGKAARYAGFLVQQFTSDQEMSLLALTAVNGKTVKIRVTYVKDPLLQEIVFESLTELHQILAAPFSADVFGSARAIRREHRHAR